MPTKIMIDPGHGGKEPGAVNQYVKEKEINLIVANKLKSLLESKGFIPQMTRYNDNYVSLDERCIIANTCKSDLFISIHHNAGGADGYEVIYSMNNIEGKRLSELVGAEFEKVGQNKRKIYYRESETSPGKDYYAVIRGTNMTAVITEFGFMDSKDYESFDTQKELELEAIAIFNAICNFYNIIPKNELLESVDILVKNEVIKSPDYWIQNAINGRTVVGEYAGELIKNMAKKLKI